jgi:hypothetical protein
MGDTKWGVLLSALAVFLSLIGLVTTAMRNDAEGVRDLERRLCRLEALNNMGDCKR